MWRTNECHPLARFGVIGGLLLLGGCTVTPVYEYGSDSTDNGYTPPRPINAQNIHDAVPRHEPRSPYGNPNSYQVNGHTYRVMQDSHGFVQRGVASWYGPNFHGKRTSSGEPYDMYKMTAAHKSLPLPTYVQVTNLDNGRQVVVRVNDRGPFLRGRILDLSYAAAVKLDMIRNGTANVEIRAIDTSDGKVRVATRPAPSPAPPPQVATSQAGSNGYVYLQAGAFSSEVNAMQLNHRLRSAIDPLINVSTSPDPARPLYRVRVGPLESVEKAMDLAAKLSRLGVSGARVIID